MTELPHALDKLMNERLLLRSPPESRRSALLKSFGRRQAYESLGSPNPRAQRAGLWGLRLCGCSGVGRNGRCEREPGCGRSGFKRRWWVQVRGEPGFAWCGGISDRGTRRSLRLRKHEYCGLCRCQAVPGHDACVPDEGNGAGGARGCAGSTTRDVKQCFAADLEHADAELNRYYASAVALPFQVCPVSGCRSRFFVPLRRSTRRGSQETDCHRVVRTASSEPAARATD
jgi:hypothetical protein